MTTPTAPERCPTCDREGCKRAAAEKEILGRYTADQWGRYLMTSRDCRAHEVDWRARAIAAESELAGAAAAICDVSDTIRRALDGDDGGMRAPYHGPLAAAARYPSIAADLRRLDEVLTIGSPRAAAMRDDVAWRAKVAPLIEELRRVAHSDDHDMMDVVEAASPILAATEPTP